MDRAVYSRMAEQELTHWWFAGRREIIAALIAREARLPPAARILEAGCGTGGNLAMLGRLGRLEGFEFDPEARRLAETHGFPVGFGALPDQVAEPDNAYDLVGLFDVLEHIEDDVGSLRTLGRKLNPAGTLLVTVPAMPWLWSSHDETHHHFRRYTRASLTSTIRAAGLEPAKVGYFNTLLFPLAVAQRGLDRMTGATTPTDLMPSPPLNRVLGSIFRTERHWTGRIPMPFGLSLFAVVKSVK